MVDQLAFRSALGCFASGVTVVTAPGDGRGPVGVTVSAFCSLSLDPPLILVCLDNRTGCIDHFLDSGAGFSVNVLAADQGALSDAFAGPQSFDLHGHGYSEGATGAPVLDGVAAALSCQTHTIHDGGDHRIVVGRVVDVQVTRERAPLVYFQSSYRELSERP
ncbi:MAG: flavin reductase [Rhodospirillaceae bacterium]|nr:flavin reductase [Magnetovibrio sp.]MAY66987.1 flavin reductase [Rhodospirillaceae bacterium]|tara:strand:+ start:367 stop:852 length:486 start_codon:yes stop_codon:yes gene_type:complete